MDISDRENRLAKAFVQLADTLVSDFDVTDLMQRLVEHCVELFDVDAAGLLLADHRGTLHLMASSSEHARLLELFQLQADEGPSLDCVRDGIQVAVPDLTDGSGLWPRFGQAALSEGYAAVHAFPLGLRAQILGAINLFSAKPSALSEDDQSAVQALADVATIGVLSERAAQNRELLVEQLEGALNSRVLIEQAKGVLAAAAGLDMEDAFTLLRRTARSSNRRLVEVAREVVHERRLPSVTERAAPDLPD